MQIKKSPLVALAQYSRMVWQALDVIVFLVIFFPLTFLIKRDSGRIAVIGRQNGLFVDNAKHVFSWAVQQANSSSQIVFFSDQDRVKKKLSEEGHICLSSLSVRGIAFLLRASYVLVDSVDWRFRGKLGATRGARIVQMWHGIPLKEIELGLHHKQQQARGSFSKALVSLYKWMTRRFPRYDLLLATSEFTRKTLFQDNFRAKKIVDFGYPRNDCILMDWGSMPSLIKDGVDQAARKRLGRHREAGGKTVLYAPTFRDNGELPFGPTRFDGPAISEWAEARNALVAVKLHPMIDRAIDLEHLDGVFLIDSVTDIYPVLGAIDILVTDFSSIYFDFLLLNRPLVFFPFDYDVYISDERELLLEYSTSAPGRKVESTRALLEELDKLIDGEDEWSQVRQSVLARFFKFRNGMAAARLLDYLSKSR